MEIRAVLLILVMCKVIRLAVVENGTPLHRLDREMKSVGGYFESSCHIQFFQSLLLLQDASEMVVACSRFLCYFCRTSRQNQKAMFEHLSFLLDNATMLLARPSLRG